MIVEMNNIRKRFDKLEVIKNISFGVGSGEVISIIGPSGSGKSTLLRCATFLETIDGGEILYQKAVEVLPGDTPEVLQRRVMEQAEWILLPKAVETVSQEVVRGTVPLTTG